MRIFLLLASILSGCSACATAKQSVSGALKLFPFTSPQPSETEVVENDTPLVNGLYRITYSDKVTDESADTVIAAIKKGQKRADATAILLELNSHGGSVDAGFRIIKVIEKSTKPVICVVDNEGYSMIFSILQSCHRRLMTKRAILMVHNPYFTEVDGKGTLDNLEDWYNRVKALTNSWQEHCSARMKISKEELEKRTYRQDWWMGWKEALQVGAVDFVIPSPNATLKPMTAPPL